VDFIDEEDIVALQIGQDGGQVAGALDGGAGGDLDVNTYLRGDDVGQAGLPQARRPVKKDMVDRLAAGLGCRNCYFKVFLGLFLPDEVGQRTGAKAGIEGNVPFRGFAGDDSFYGPAPFGYLSLRDPTKSGRGNLKIGFSSTMDIAALSRFHRYSSP
jgi:hypothetical protein